MLQKIKKSYFILFFILIISLITQAQTYQWSNVEIVAGGFVTGIIYHPSAPGVAYMRTDMGGAYRFNAAAQAWEPITDHFSNVDWNMLGIESMAIDPTNSNRVYMACGTYAYNNWAGNASFFRSSDRGSTWVRTNLPFKLGANEPGRGMGERLQVDPNSPNILYLGTRQNGLWRSLDFGATWNQITSFPTVSTPSDVGLPIVIIDPSSGSSGNPSQTIYVTIATATAANFYRSMNGGLTWQSITGGPTGMMPYRAVLVNNSLMYLTYSNAPGPNGISTGAVVRFNPQTLQWTTLLTPNGQGGFAGLAVDPTNSNIIMAATICRWWPNDEIYRSTNGGATWVTVGTGSNISRNSAVSPYIRFGAANDNGIRTGNWVSALAFDPSNTNKVIYATGATVWGSDNIKNSDTGGQVIWGIKGKGVEQTAVLDLKSPPSGPYLLSGLGDICGFIHNDVKVSPPQGVIDPGYKNGESVDYAELNPSYMAIIGHDYTPNYFGSYSTNSGATWTRFSSIPPGAQDGMISCNANGSTLIWAPRNMTPYRSVNNGTTWTATNGIGGTASLVADKVNPLKFYAIRNNTLYRSVDGGMNFTTAATSGFSGTKLKTTPGFENHIWVPASNGMYRSIDGGISFTRVNNVQNTSALGFGKNATGQTYPAIYAIGTINNIYGIHRSDDAGVTWVRINDDMHQYGGIGQSITGDSRVYGRVYVATNGRGIVLGELPPTLPVDVLEFSIKKGNNDTYFQWTVLNESGITTYYLDYIENLSTGIWKSIDTVLAQPNNGEIRNYYSSSKDFWPSGYYRLRTNENEVKGQLFWNGNVSFKNLFIYPNPSYTDQSIKLLTEHEIDPLPIEIYTLTGKIVYKGLYHPNDELDLKLPAGMYCIRILSKNDVLVVQWIVQ
ncbi:MAG: T9SS type A sorting domain-containing protein [Cytophagaceae bacterium]|jgi:hypothetical protein|nr:T9SS type A sorting domain-containing protein [Cytophagaceae bacterium]